MRKSYVYGLREKGTEEIRYVGMTTDLDRRLREHLGGRFQNYEKYTWIEGIKELGGEIEMVVLEESHWTKVRESERAWVKRLDKINRLHNMKLK